MDGLRSFGSSLVDGFLGGAATRPSQGPGRRDPVTSNERPAAARQIHRSMKAWREKESDAPANDEANAAERDAEAAAPESAAESGAPAVSDANSAAPAGSDEAGNSDSESKSAGEADAAADRSRSEEAAGPEEQAPEVATKPISVAAKLKGVHRKVFLAANNAARPAPEVKSPTDGKPPQMASAAASQASQAAAQPNAATVKPVVKIEPIIGKVTQAKQMVDMWVTKNVPTAPALAAMLAAVLPKLQELAAGAATAADLKARLTAAAAELQAIADKDKEWKFYSLESAGQTLLNTQKQLPIEVEAFSCKQSLPLGEFQSQIRQSQEGLNSLLVSDWEQNRNNYKAGQAGGAGGGRSKVGSAMQKEYNNRHGRPLAGAAPHNADQIAGGSPDPTGLPSNVRVNSAIGPQWDTPGRIQKVDKAVKEYKEKEGEPAAAVTQMSVTLTVVSVPDP